MIDKNKKILMLVESPNKVKTISKILKELGYDHCTVMATMGHITNIKDNRKSYKNTGIHPEKDFKIDYGVMEDKYKTVESIKAQVTKAYIVLIASDDDREGESIGYHIKNFAKIPEDKYYRVTYHSITRDAIESALNQPRKLNENLYHAAEARQVIDKLVGYSLSPIAKTYVGAKSVGRCQSAGLKLIADREQEIEDFIPETYYDVFVFFEKNGKQFKAKYIGTEDCKIDRISDKSELNVLSQTCTGDYFVNSIQTKSRKQSAPAPFCTATFQQEAVNRLGLSVKGAMSCAQKLFEGFDISGNHTGLITYMRTDSTEIAQDFIPTLKDFIETQIKSTFKLPKVGKKTGNEQEGHECLRVVDLELTPEIVYKELNNELLGKVYELIWKRTVASAMPDALFSETVYNINNSKYRFTMTSNELIDPGFTAIYKPENSDSEIVKETFTEGEVLQVVSQL